MAKRDHAYYLRRMEKEHPDVYADVLAGKIGVPQARIATGLLKKPSGLSKLKTAWRKATAVEKREFFLWVGATAKGLPATAPTAPPASAVVNSERRLLPATIDRIQHIMMKRRLKIGDIMTEMGFEPLDASLGFALRRHTRIADKIIKALPDWLEKNQRV